MNRKERALKLFYDGYNCTQAIMIAYHDLVDIDETLAFKLSSGFEGGIAKLGKTCGTLNASIMLLSLRYGETNKDDTESKMKRRNIIRDFVHEFEEHHENGINCIDILREEKDKVYTMHSEKCARTVSEVCDLLDKYMFL